MGNKEQIIKELIEQLEDLMEADWGEASDFLNNLPDEYWKDSDIAIGLIKQLSYYFNEMDDYNLNDLIPDIFWEDKYNTIKALKIILPAETFNLSAIFPSKYWEDYEVASLVISYDYCGIYEVPPHVENYKDLVFQALYTLEERIQNNIYYFPAIPWEMKEHLDYFLSYISKDLKKDQDFILELLEHEFYDKELKLIFNWIDQDLLQNQEFLESVAEILDIDIDDVKEYFN